MKAWEHFKTITRHKIYVMKAGRVVQQGTHAALLAEGGLYETLWENQQALEQYAYTKEAAV